MAIRLFRKKDESDRKIKIPEGMWIKCAACLEIIYKPEVERNLNVCPKCVYHFRIPARERIRAVIDEGTFVEFAGRWGRGTCRTSPPRKRTAVG